MDSFRAFRTRAAAFWIFTVWASSEESIFTKASAIESRRSFAMNFLPYMNQNHFRASVEWKINSVIIARESINKAQMGLRGQDLMVLNSLVKQIIWSIKSSDSFLLILVRICFRINKQIPSLLLWYKCKLLLERHIYHAPSERFTAPYNQTTVSVYPFEIQILNDPAWRITISVKWLKVSMSIQNNII